MPLAKKSSTPPDPRYNHAMVSVQNGQEVFLFGGFRGDGTRLGDVFLLDLVSPVGGEADVGSDEEEKEDSVDDEAVQVRHTHVSLSFYFLFFIDA